MNPTNIPTEIQKKSMDNESLKVLYDVMKLLLSSNSLRKTLDEALQLILSMSWLKSQRKGGIFLVGVSGQQLELIVSNNLGAKIVETCEHVKFGHCLCGRAAQDKTLQFADCIDARHDVRFEGMQPHGHYNVPLLGRNNDLLGVLALYLSQGHKKSTSEIFWLKEVANALAVVIEQKSAQSILNSYMELGNKHTIVSATNIEGDITFVNDKFCEVSGYSRGELLGLNHRIINSGEHTKDLFRNMYKTCAEGGVWKAVLRNRAKSGSYYWVDTSVTSSRDAIGRINGYISIRTDVTKLQDQKLLLRKNNKYFDLALANMALGISLFDFNRKLIFSNKRYQDLFQLPTRLVQRGIPLSKIIKSVVSKGRYRTLNKGEYPFLNGEEWDKLRRGESEYCQNIVIDDKNLKHIKINTEVVEGLGWVSTYTDISERVQREANLIDLAEKAREGEKVKSEFLSTMSHELRTPLNGILGVASLLDNSPLSVDQKHLLSVMKSSGTLLLSIINDILDLSKLNAGKMEPTASICNIEDLLVDLLSLLTPMAEDRGIELILDFDPGIPVVIIGDYSRIRQILLNLVGNAIKFTDVGFVMVKVAGTVFEGNVDMSISVIDSGIGLSKKDIDRIFSEFTQGDSSNTRKYGGIGLGLSVSSKLAELIDGKIHVESVLNEGSTFTLNICSPIAEECQSDLLEIKALDYDKVAIIIGGKLEYSKFLAKKLAVFGFYTVHTQTLDDFAELARKTNRKFKYTLGFKLSHDGVFENGGTFDSVLAHSVLKNLFVIDVKSLSQTVDKPVDCIGGEFPALNKIFNNESFRRLLLKDFNLK